MTIEQAKSIQLTDYLQSIGFAPCKQQNNNLWYLSPLRNENTPSFKVNLARNQWYDFGIGKGGDIIALVMELHRTDVAGALRILDDKPTVTNSFSFRQQESFQCFEDIRVKPLANPALLKFLQERQISLEVASEHCTEVYYKLGGKSYFAVAFENEKGGYEIRNKYFKGCISPKDITHLFLTNNTCCVFEGFMDMLSFLTICKQKGISLQSHDLLVLNSTANLPKSIPILRNYESVHTYLDNDQTGQFATSELKRQLGGKVIGKSEIYRDFKDLNDYLQNRKLENKVVNSQVIKIDNQPPKRKKSFRL